MVWLPVARATPNICRKFSEILYIFWKKISSTFCSVWDSCKSSHPLDLLNPIFFLLLPFHHRGLMPPSELAAPPPVDTSAGPACGPRAAAALCCCCCALPRCCCFAAHAAALRMLCCASAHVAVAAPRRSKNIEKNIDVDFDLLNLYFWDVEIIYKKCWIYYF